MDVDRLWKVLDSVQAQIRVFDAKAQIVIAIDGVLAGFFGSQTVKIAELLALQPFSVISWSLMLIGAACLVALASSMMFAVFTVHPRLHLNQPPSRIFFAHLYEEFGRDYAKARDALTSVSDEHLSADIANQVLATSIICSTKAHRFKYGLFTMCGAVLLWIAILFCQFIAQHKITASVAAVWCDSLHVSVDAHLQPLTEGTPNVVFSPGTAATPIAQSKKTREFAHRGSRLPNIFALLRVFNSRAGSHQGDVWKL
jgi:Family of unknown function (DUF5706)